MVNSVCGSTMRISARQLRDIICHRPTRIARSTSGTTLKPHGAIVSVHDFSSKDSNPITAHRISTGTVGSVSKRVSHLAKSRQVRQIGTVQPG